MQISHCFFNSQKLLKITNHHFNTTFHPRKTPICAHSVRYTFIHSLCRDQSTGSAKQRRHFKPNTFRSFRLSSRRQSSPPFRHLWCVHSFTSFHTFRGTSNAYIVAAKHILAPKNFVKTLAREIAKGQRRREFAGALIFGCIFTPVCLVEVCRVWNRIKRNFRYTIYAVMLDEVTTFYVFSLKINVCKWRWRCNRSDRSVIESSFG